MVVCGRCLHLVCLSYGHFKRQGTFPVGIPEKLFLVGGVGSQSRYLYPVRLLQLQAHQVQSTLLGWPAHRFGCWNCGCAGVWGYPCLYPRKSHFAVVLVLAGAVCWMWWARAAFRGYPPSCGCGLYGEGEVYSASEIGGQGLHRFPHVSGYLGQGRGSEVVPAYTFVLGEVS